MKIKLDAEQERILRDTLKHSLVSRERIVEYLDIQIDVMPHLQDKEKFPANTDEDIAYLKGKQEAYEEIKRQLNSGVNNTELLKLILFKG